MRNTGIMKSNLIFLFLLLTIPVGFVVAAHADTQYVSDMLVLTIRDNPDKDANILGNLKTADPVEILEAGDRFMRIRTKEGLEGWVQKNFITADKPKAIIIKEMKNEISQLKSKLEEFENNRDADLNEIRASSQDDKLKIKQFTEKYNNLLKESKTKTATLTGERDKLKAINTELNIEVDNLKQDLNSNPKTKRIQFFLVGAGVLLLGFFLGLASKRKKSYYR
ncbi:MAG: TIGR04211 family SH3 domain-containing protein [Desulfobacterales bacterium]|uniref:TIGR04211 family SH3 domain-containing protein n=1 Tax=Candidatus Desulfatibia vada TaxID=2841696 RepID=A0A8J6P1P2_9BACT|nr:TIGR04211 family SH3 domain-containing protein [Candidatus Desulfatibia vada]MBL6970575.1 TIGR04211 family SH3 domain-containing protein [Desulfobacterales bacterium]